VAEIRCPMCSQANPEEAEVCAFCSARLRPLLAGGPAEGIPPSEAEPEETDWLSRIRQEAVRGQAEPTPPPPEEGGPDWLSRLRRAEAEEEGPPKGEVPAWVSDAVEPAPPQPAAPAEPEVPDWLARVRERKAAEDVPAEESAPEPEEDWLSRLRVPQEGQVPPREAPPLPEILRPPDEGTPAIKPPPASLPSWLPQPPVEEEAAEESPALPSTPWEPPSRPIAVLTVQAPTDTLVPYEGGGLFPSAAESFAHWRAHDACGPGDPEQQVVQGESRCDFDTGCAGGVEVGFCTVASTGVYGGHIVYLNPDFALAEVAWEFLSRFSLPTAPPALPVPLAGKKLALKDAADASKRKLSVSLKDAALAPGPGFDPTADGAMLVVHNANGSGEQVCLPLPAAGWKRKGQGFAYRDAKQLAGPCKAAKVAPGALSVSCDGRRGALDYSLDEPSQGSLAARFESSGETFCARFGGTVSKDQSTAAGKKATFQATGSPAPEACEAPPAPCPD